jgi:hypothetical protein
VSRRRRETFNDDVRQRLRFESEARAKGLPFTGRVCGRPRRLTYRVPITVPVYDDERTLTIIMPASAVAGAVPAVNVNGPICLRHRYCDGSLCLWWGEDPTDDNWVPTDGLLALVNLARTHTYCEERCRRGEGWPRPEAPTQHRESCPACKHRR